MQEESIALIDMTMSRHHHEYRLFHISIPIQTKFTRCNRSIANDNCERPTHK